MLSCFSTDLLCSAFTLDVGVARPVDDSFVQPFIFHWKVFAHEANFGRILVYVLNIAFGVFLSVTGVYYTVLNIMASPATSGLFDGQCYENSFFLGSSNGTHDALTAGGYSCAKGPDSFYAKFYNLTCGPDGNITCSQYGVCAT